MRISRIRKFKKGGEITLVVTREEARSLSFGSYFRSSQELEWQKCQDIDDVNKGHKLLRTLHIDGFNKLW